MYFSRAGKTKYIDSASHGTVRFRFRPGKKHQKGGGEEYEIRFVDNQAGLDTLGSGGDMDSFGFVFFLFNEMAGGIM